MLARRSRSLTSVFSALLLATVQGSAAAPVPDTMAQRVLACTGCHGPQGRASAEGFVPRLAGKPAPYLQRQLLSFRAGQRRHAGMASLLEGLPDGYLNEMAAHFAALQLPPEPPSRRPLDGRSRERAETLVHQGDPAFKLPACAACHGRQLGGTERGVPGLAGLPSAYVAAQLGAWRVGSRRASTPDCMQRIAAALPLQDIAALADWLAAQPAAPPTRATDAAATPPPMPCGGMGLP